MLFAVVVWGAYRVPRLGVFSVRRIAVTGASAVSDVRIRRVAESTWAGKTVYTVDPAQVARAVRTLPFVSSVHVTTHLPDGIGIAITEYKPLGLAEDAAGHAWLVSRDGRILAAVRIADWQAHLPVVDVGPERLKAGHSIANNPAFKLLMAVPPTFPQPVTEVNVTSIGLALKLQNGIDVRIGTPLMLARKLAVAARLLQLYARAPGARLRVVNVTVPAIPATMVDR